MERIFGSENVKRPFRNAVIALGNFDGVHLGHRHIIAKTIELAKGRDGLSVVYTFNPHPVKILAADSCPSLIQTLEQRLSSLEDLKVDVCVVENFTHEFAKQSAGQFFESMLIGRLGAKAVVVGYDFTFGYHRGGTIELLELLGRKHNVEIVVIEARFVGDLLLSSTEIRHFVSTGHMEDARKMLGKPFAIEGRVVAGKGLGGYLGAHTANIESANELLPGNGVYLTVTQIKERNPPTPVKGRGPHGALRPPLIKGGKGGIWPSITSIGHNPTFPGEPLSIETHLLGFDGNLLGEIIRIEFLRKMRDQIAFPSVEKLHDQIAKDVEEARRWHEKNNAL